MLKFGASNGKRPRPSLQETIETTRRKLIADSSMAGRAKKSEHAGPKKGHGAYWGRKADAKRESNRLRRENAKRAVRQGMTDLSV